MKTLILKSGYGDFEKYFIDNMQNNDTDTYDIYINSSTIGHYLSVIYIKIFHLPFEKILYGTWKKRIKEYDRIIVFDRVLSWKVLDYIHKCAPNCRIIFWYWNTIESPHKLLHEKYREYCEVWSFDKCNCIQYKLHYNIQFYFKLENVKQCEKYDYDAIFVGYDKGRFCTIKKINNKLRSLGYKTQIIVVWDKTSKENNSIYRKKGISYTDLIKLIQRSRCIIDIPQKGQSGITLRVLESIYFNKKLITTDKSIKDFKFYDKNNILLWNDVSDIKINEFFERKYRPIDKTILSENTFEAWLDNFEN